MAIEIVSFPIKNCYFPSFFVCLPEGNSLTLVTLQDAEVFESHSPATATGTPNRHARSALFAPWFNTHTHHMVGTIHVYDGVWLVSQSTYIYIYCITFTPWYNMHITPYKRCLIWNRMVAPQCRLSPRIPCLTAGQSAALSLSAFSHTIYGPKRSQKYDNIYFLNI